MHKTTIADAQKLLNFVGKAIAYVGIIILVAMMLLTVIDVILRYLFNRPIMGGLEITQLMMVSISFVMLIFCTMQKAHVKVDIFANYISKRLQRIINTVFYIGCLGMLLIMGWQNMKEAIHLKHVQQSTDILEIPIYPFYMIIAVASVITGLLLLVFIFEKPQERSNH